MSNRTVEAILRLSAKLGDTRAFNRIASELARVDSRAKQFNRSQMLVAQGSRVMSAALLRYAAPAALTYGLKQSVVAFADIERTMTRIGITADASRERMASVRTELFTIADGMKVPVENLVAGLDSLVASGKSLDEAMALLPSVARTAHAAGADFGEMATTADAIGNSFGIAAGQMERAFDIIAKGGKAGKFELKDMANYLPSLSPAFAALGYTGETGLRKLTAALQVVRMETGRSEEAATAFMDVLTKMNSTTIANNFKKNFGVDLPGSMKKAKESGEDLLDAFIRISRETVKGDLSKLPLLFTDKQMLIGMRALINHTGDLNSLFRELSNSAGTVNADIGKLAKDSQSAIDRMANAWERLKQAVGKEVAPAVTGALDAVTNKIARDDAVDRELRRRGMDDGEIARWRSLSMIPGTAANNEYDAVARAGGYVSPDDRAKMDAVAGIKPLPSSRDHRAPAVPLSAIRAATGGAPAPSYSQYRFGGEATGPHAGRSRPMQGPPVDPNFRAPGSPQLGMQAPAIFEEFQRGGQDAGRAVKEGVTSGGQDAGAAIGDAIRAAGRDAANQIRGVLGHIGPVGRDTGKSASTPGQL